jgi:hypothetical protein
MEQLLTTGQINDIVAFAGRCPELRHPNAVNIGLEVTTILKMGFKTGVIIIHGNKDTGFEHIKARHDFYGKAFCDKKGNLTSPGKFSPRSIPIMDYTEIADAMYNEAFLNVDGNKAPDLFDLYQGIPEVAEAEGRNFRMLLYKNTKIVHNLFPTNKLYSVKKPAGFNFEKGRVFVNGADKQITTVTVPYYDHQQELRYTAVVTYDFFRKQEYLKIVIHRNGKQNLTTEMGPEPSTAEKISSGELQGIYTFSELRDIEEVIAAIEKDKKEWGKMP